MTALQDSTNAAVVGAIEANLYAFGTTQFAKWPRIDVFNKPHLLWFECDVPSPMFNVVHRARFSAENVDAGITAVKERYTLRDLPFVWWVDPSSTPLKLSKHLTSTGFVPTGEITGMAMNLTTNKKRETEKGIQHFRHAADFDVLPTTDAESLVVFARTMCAGFEVEPDIEQPMVELTLAMGFGTEGPLINYVGTLDGRPVATSSLFMDSGIAGIYNVSTLPEARRRGIGTAVTMTPLLEAARRGCNLAVLHASAMAVPMYQRLGLNSYCYFHQYQWPPSQD